MSVLKTTIIIPKTGKVSYKRVLGRSREYKRSEVTIKETISELRITIQARDMASLRASINSITRDIQVITDSLKVG